MRACARRDRRDGGEGRRTHWVRVCDAALGPASLRYSTCSLTAASSILRRRTVVVRQRHLQRGERVGRRAAHPVGLRRGKGPRGPGGASRLLRAMMQDDGCRPWRCVQDTGVVTRISPEPPLCDAMLCSVHLAGGRALAGPRGRRLVRRSAEDAVRACDSCEGSHRCEEEVCIPLEGYGRGADRDGERGGATDGGGAAGEGGSRRVVALQGCGCFCVGASHRLIASGRSCGAHHGRVRRGVGAAERACPTLHAMCEGCATMHASLCCGARHMGASGSA